MRVPTTLFLSLCLSLVLTGRAFGAEATQTDWSGGGGFPGPVTQWIDRFASSQAVDWTTTPGELTLSSGLPLGHQVTTTFGEPAGVAAADLDGDTDLDVVSVAYQGNEVAWWENNGAGGEWTRHTVVTSFNGACSLHPCDIDRDGDIDIAATAETGHKVAWWANDGSGGGWVEHVIDANILGPFSVCDADFDRDGDVDLCGAAFNASDIVWWENVDGFGATWIKHTVDANFAGAWWADASDLDGDGDADILGAGFNASDVCWWENNGDGSSWTKRFIDANFPNALCVRAVDMDGDGGTDVLAAAYQGQVAWWKYDGMGDSWTKHLIDSPLNHPFSVRAADLDGDGDPDVISNERDGNRVMWYENADASGSVWSEHTVDETSRSPNDVLAADLDGDGGQEIVGTYSLDNSILWYEPMGEYAGAGSLDSSILDAGGPVHDWGSVVWTSSTPLGTGLRVEVRAAQDPGNMGPWVEVVSSGDDLSNYVANGTQCLQYRLSFVTEDGTVSPRVEDIRVQWDFVTDVGEEGGSHESRFSCQVRENPSSRGTATIYFVLPHASEVELTLFDGGGRRAKTTASGTCAAGDHSLTVQGLSHGVYLYRLRAGAFRSAGKMVVG
jgi:hypothetical protein